jgi:hypothetical protein
MGTWGSFPWGKAAKALPFYLVLRSSDGRRKDNIQTEYKISKSVHAGILYKYDYYTTVSSEIKCVFPLPLK